MAERSGRTRRTSPPAEPAPPHELTIELCKDHVESDAPLELTVTEADAGLPLAAEWTVTNPGPATFRGAIRLVLPLPERFTRPWFLVPGFFYGENRAIGQRAPKLYPRFDPSVRRPAEMTSSWWDFGADRTAAPLVYVHQDDDCLAAAAEPYYRTSGPAASDDDEPQIGLGFGHDGRAGYVRFTVPACEEPFRYANLPAPAAAIHWIALPPETSVSGRIYLYRFAGGRHDYQRVLEDYAARLEPANPPAPLPEVRSLVADAAHGVVARHYHREGNYFIYSRPYMPVIEQIANARGTTMEWHQMLTGFISGLLVCRGLLHAAALTGDEDARRVALRVAERICREGRSPSGFFWADFVPAAVASPNGTVPNPLARGRREWGCGWQASPGVLHARTVADACDHLAAMIALERNTRGESDATRLWSEALEGNLRAALEAQLPGGSYGQCYDPAVGRAVRAEGCGGLPWIPAMVKAIGLGLGGAELVERMGASVRRAAEAYAPAVEAEAIWGAPEDNDSPSSEDGMNAVVAYADLYALFGEARHLALARQAADWMLTFRKTYNQRLPEASLMGRYGLRSRGGDYASASNNHLHIFEVLATRQLCELSRWTGNPYYRRRAMDHWAFACQYLSRCDGMYNGFRGAMAEQFYWCEWGSWNSRWRPPAGHRQKGSMAPFTAVWCLAVLLVAAPDAAREFA